MKFNIVLLTVLIAILACGTVEDEESLQMLAKGDTYDDVRSGARLILNYDAATRAFVGTVENTTSSTLQRVRVEVHLSNGTELGPTMPSYLPLPPGEKMNIKLDASGESFSTWSAHAEVG
ncbi:MAG: FxLYD domain-containing protein [Candidatus Poribacteria bacterium]|nr:FxLYD domain-containing protein [Candidatus Poribacteria bacterium]